MMTIALRRFDRRDGTVLFALDPLYRIVFGILAAFLVVGLVARGEPGWGPAIVLAVILAGVLYDERWLIDRAAGTLTSRSGLPVPARRRRWSIDEIAAVEYTHHRAGSLPGVREEPPSRSEEDGTEMRRSAGGLIPRRRATHYLWYGLKLTDGSRVRVEIRRVKNWDRDLAVARSFADALEVTFRERED